MSNNCEKSQFPRIQDDSDSIQMVLPDPSIQTKDIKFIII